MPVNLNSNDHTVSIQRDVTYKSFYNTSENKNNAILGFAYKSQRFFLYSDRDKCNQ